MRVLFTSLPATSHIQPALPLAREFLERGWEVAVAASPSMAPYVSSKGLRFFPVGLDWTESDAVRAFPELETMSLDEQGYWWVSDIFADRAARPSSHDLLEVYEEWQPQLVVRDYWDFGAWAASEVSGVPTAVLGLAMFTAPDEWEAFIGTRLQALREQVGVPADGGFDSLYDGPYVDLLPASYQIRQPPNVVRMRPVTLQPPAQEVPTWVASLPDRPTILVTFGTVFNQVPDSFETVIAGLADEPVNVIVTTGHGRDPAELGPLPANTRAEEFVDHAALLPRCDAVVCHAGFNTTMAVLAHDLPIIAIPLSADQPVHAERCRQLGIGSVIPHPELTPETVRAQVNDVLGDPSFRQCAASVGEEIRSMPDPSAVVEPLIRAASDADEHLVQSSAHSRPGEHGAPRDTL